MTLERRVLVWMCVLVAVNQLGFGAMIPSLPLYAQSFGVPASAIGMAIAAYGLSRFVIAIPSGQMADRLGRRPTIAIGGLVSALGNLWCAFATSYPEFIVARFVAGAGAGLVLTTGQVVLADISTPQNRGRTISIYQGTFIAAVGIGPFPGGLLAEHVGLSAPFIAYGLAALVVTVVAWFAVAETRDIRATPGTAGKTKLPPLATQVKLLTSQIGYMLVSLITFTHAVVRTGALFAIMPILAVERLGISVAAIGFAMMIGSVSGLLASYPGGWISDRFGRKAVIVPTALVTAVSMLLYCLAPSYAWFLAAAILWGIASSVGSAAPAAYAADSAPDGMNAAAMSTYRMMGDFGYVVGPLGFGLVVDAFGPVTAMVGAAAAIGLVGIVFAILAPESHKSRGKL